MIKHPVKIGSEATYSPTENRLVRVKVAALETLNTLGVEYEDTIRLEIEHTFRDGHKSKETAWLAKNVGLVKWIRPTGRIDELVSNSWSKKEN